MATDDRKDFLTTKEIQAQIRNKRFGWRCGDTGVSRLTRLERQLRLGLDVKPEEVERVKRMMDQAPAAEMPVTVETSVDWRTKNGNNWVTSVQDQGSCGSCVAFATVATIETQARLHYKRADWEVDLSEADLFFCGAGMACKKGWWPSYALDYAKLKGVPEEACFPYSDHDQACNSCSDRDERLVAIGEWKEVVNVDDRKEWLADKGPMIACMAVYEDFFYYQSGVYRHATGALAGYHAISCIGYSQDEACWICKNSWGKDWGDKGFFKIGYGEAEIDTGFAMYGVGKIGGTLKPEEDGDEDKEFEWVKYLAVDHDFSSNQRILWAHVGGEWRRKVMTDAQLAHTGLMLGRSTKVRAKYKGSEILRIQGFRAFE